VRILITGATSGLGEGLAKVYAGANVHLGLVGRRAGELARVGREVEARGAKAELYPVDVTDTAQMSRTVEAFAKAAGGLDLVIANAGIGEGRKGERFDAERVAEVFRVNVIGLTNTLLPALPILREQGSGTVVGVASVAAYRALPGSLAYSASKGAVMTFMEGLEMELHGTGIHAMALCPGFIRTPLTDKNDFSMPFLLECDDACRRMRRAIDAKESRYTFPWQMRGLAQVMRVAPQWLLRQVSPKSPHRRPSD
jgi:short-subunit dehydrogenase